MKADQCQLYISDPTTHLKLLLQKTLSENVIHLKFYLFRMKTEPKSSLIREIGQDLDTLFCASLYLFYVLHSCTLHKCLHLWELSNECWSHIFKNHSFCKSSKTLYILLLADVQKSLKVKLLILQTKFPITGQYYWCRCLRLSSF